MVEITDLPEPILQDIVSWMKSDDAIEASLCCKTWFRAWLTRPNLEIQDLEIRRYSFVIANGQLPCLKRLCFLGRYTSCQRLEVESPSLESLTVCRDSVWLILHPYRDDRGISSTLKIASSFYREVVLVDAPKLNEFVYDGYTIPQHVSSALRQWTSTIKILLSQKMDNSCFYKLKGLITELNHSKLSLDLNYRGCSIEFDIKGVIADGLMFLPCPSVERLSLKGSGDEESLTSMLDGFFWGCRPKLLSLKWSCLGGIIDYKDSPLERVMKGQHGDLRHGSIKFWQQSLKSAKLEVLDHRKHKVVHFFYLLDWETSITTQ
ncbi:OLC1v1009983C1 [Oldenlandia corymbosa var. corymbosa]|uniref:OLC1v1009983C1 n=1 Tax=Oldenlandia corymbosa var. corymbosa TaxID=529605 RepID=A0AAV1DTH1_OLDCO|nr:OLC1v1009983C1 [Oldenlandia corymbosa var. corymbosa]